MSVIKFSVDPDVNYSLALKKIEEQDYLFAIELLKEAINTDFNYDYYIELAELYYKLGQYEESAFTYVELLDRFISMEVAFGLLHSVQKGQGKVFDPNEITIPSSTYFKMTRNKVENSHIDRIIREFHETFSKTQNEGSFIYLEEEKIKNLIELGRDYAIQGKYEKALSILDSIESDKFKLKILEIKVIICLGAGYYEKTLDFGWEYYKLDPTNVIVLRALLYAQFEIDGRVITPKFENEFDSFISLISNNDDDLDGLLAIYDLSEMVGYKTGTSKLIDKTLKNYCYDVSVLLTAIAYFAKQKDINSVEKYLKLANLVHEGNPSVNYYNCIFQLSRSLDLQNDAWDSIVDYQLASRYANVFVINYLKDLKSGTLYFDRDVMRVAMAFLTKDKLKEFIFIKEIIGIEEYKNLLIWGIESPYIGIENKIVLIQAYINKFPNTDKVFIIPSELGVTCSRLCGIIDKDCNLLEKNLFNEVYPNLLFTLHEVDRGTLIKSVKKVVSLNKKCESQIMKATVHLIYHKFKKYESQMELVAGTYQVALNELKIYYSYFME